MTSMARLIMAAFRMAYGGFFVAVGLYGGVSLLSGDGNPFDVQPGPGADFQAALEGTGFVVPVMLLCFVIGGAALLRNRTAPLGIIVLAPFVVVIFLYHLLPGGNAPWGAFWAAGLLLLAWRYRKAFKTLVAFEDGDDLQR